MSDDYNEIDDSRAELVQRVWNRHPVNLCRVDKSLHVVLKPEDTRHVATQPLKYRAAVMDHVGHHMNLCLLPRNHLAVVPDVFRRLNWHRELPCRRAQFKLLPCRRFDYTGGCKSGRCSPAVVAQAPNDLRLENIGYPLRESLRDWPCLPADHPLGEQRVQQ